MSIDIDFFTQPLFAIEINDYKYNVLENAYKKYFILGNVDNARFKDIHKYELVIDDVPASQLVSDNIILELHSSFTCNFINKDQKNTMYYVKFINMFLHKELIIDQFSYIYELRAVFTYFEKWITDAGFREMPEFVYEHLSRVFQNVLIDVYENLGIKIDRYKYDDKHCTTYLKMESLILKFGWYQKYSNENILIFEAIEQAQINIFGELLEYFDLSDDEIALLDIDIESSKFNEPTKLMSMFRKEHSSKPSQKSLKNRCNRLPPSDKHQ